MGVASSSNKLLTGKLRPKINYLIYFKSSLARRSELQINEVNYMWKILNLFSMTFAHKDF